MSKNWISRLQLLEGEFGIKELTAFVAVISPVAFAASTKENSKIGNGCFSATKPSRFSPNSTENVVAFGPCERGSLDFAFFHVKAIMSKWRRVIHIVACNIGKDDFIYT